MAVLLQKATQSLLSGESTFTKGPHHLTYHVTRWIKDGQFLDLTSANKFQIVGKGNLVISGIQKGDAGWYTCSARNLAGTKETTPTEIKITGGENMEQMMEEEEEERCVDSGDENLW